VIEAYFRPKYQQFFVDPIANWLLSYKVSSPIAVTVVAMIVGILAGVLIAVHQPIVACIFLALSGYCDTLDGTLARISQQTSALGSMLDIVVDRVVEFAVILGLLSVDPALRAFPAMWMLGSILLCMTSFLVVGIFVENQGDKGFHYSVGLMERAEAFIFFGLMILLPAWFVVLAWVFSALVLLTAVRRIYEFAMNQRDI